MTNKLIKYATICRKLIFGNNLDLPISEGYNAYRYQEINKARTPINDAPKKALDSIFGL